MNPLQQRLTGAIDAARETILSVSHQIHAHPELGYQEVFASDLLARTLQAAGFQVESGFAGIPTALRAWKGRGGRRVAFLAEYDALPGLGHACGHNVIAASALAAGIGLGAVAEQAGGEVWVVGTPAEETDGAKCYMVERGVFDGLDAVLMVHPYAGSYTTAPTLALSAVTVDFYGRPAHAAASPWEGVNALDAVIQLFNSLNALRQQLTPDVRIHGIISQGGDAPNIIPEHTQAKFYLRAARRETVAELNRRFEAAAQGAALASGCRVEIVHPEKDFWDMRTALPLAERFRNYMVDALGAEAFRDAPDSFGSSDIGNVSHVAPAIQPLVDITGGQPYLPHTPEFARAACSPAADQAIVRAGKGLALTGLDVLLGSV
ncbi:MAG: M20 family metallopeptidase [Chloroflexota bacterium]